MDAKLWIRKNQLARRNLTDDQRAMNAVGIIELETEKAKRDRAKAAVDGREVKAGRKDAILGAHAASKIKLPKERTRKATAKKSGVSERKIRKAQSLKKKNPKLAEKVASGEVPLNKAVKEQAKNEREEALSKAQDSISASARQSLESVCDIRVCSCADLFRSGIKPDAVITDPPYPKEFLGAFSELAESCKLAKVPLVAVMSGQSHLPEVLRTALVFPTP